MIAKETGAGGWPDRFGYRSVLALGAVLGLACFGYYYRLGLTVAHYDAKAHLVVARGVLDSARPGYLQLGTHWLPLTHLLYLPFVWFESQYRSGVLPSLLSVFCFALSAGLVYRVACRASGSGRGGIFAGLFLLANANLQYLQSCPLTEPLYMALLLLTVDGFWRWRDRADSSLPWRPAIWAALGALCRYEGWYVIAGILLMLAGDYLLRRAPRPRTLKAAVTFATIVFLPVSLHFGYLYLRIGDSFLIRVAQGNPAPFETYRRPFLSMGYHAAELAQIAGGVPLLAGIAGIIYCLARKERLQKNLPLFLLWLPSLINLSALYWGMMYRIRYSSLLVPAIAVFASLPISGKRAARNSLLGGALLAACMPWLSWFFPHEWQFRAFNAGPGLFLLPALGTILYLVAEARIRYFWPLLMLCVLGMQVPALQGEYRPILEEAMEHRFIEPDRAQVIEYLRLNYDGGRILIDAQKLSPLIYDSRLPVREFIFNEGNPAEWRRALASPGEHADWICVQKGDELADLLRVDPQWADGYSLVVHNEWLALYRRSIAQKSRF